MSKSLDLLIKRLIRLIDEKVITKIELSRRSGIDRTSLDKYLKGISIPGFDVLDKLAGVLECDPRELIKPENEPITRPHTLEDCIKVVSSSARGQSFTETIDRDHAGTKEYHLNSPQVTELFPPELVEKLLKAPKETQETIVDLVNNFLKLSVEMQGGISLGCADAVGFEAAEVGPRPAIVKKSKARA